MSKHTPGPWSIFTIASPVGISYRIHAGNRDIAHIPRDWSYEPDARLITAAPDLLKALQDAIKSRWLSIDYEHNRTQEACAIRKAICDAIDKAIHGDNHEQAA